MEEMKTLYLDLGTTIGWLICDGDNTSSGSFYCGANKGEDTNIRYGRFNSWLGIKLQGVTKVYYEQVRRHMSTDSAHVYGGLTAILYMNCLNKGIQYIGEGVKTIKKFVTGTGNADKDMVIKAVKRHGYRPIDNNEADAIALYLTIREKTSGESANAAQPYLTLIDILG